MYGARHIIKQLAIVIKSEARHITDARILLNERATKEDTLSGLVADGSITAEKKTQLMAEYDAKKKAELEAKSPKVSTVSTCRFGVTHGVHVYVGRSPVNCVAIRSRGVQDTQSQRRPSQVVAEG